MAPKLDRIPYFDPASRDYPIRPLLAARPKVLKDKSWRLPSQFPLDQGEEGACVGFGWCAELGSEPVMYNTTTKYAFSYYENARNEDRAMGNHWPSGASVLAGAKVAKKSGMVGVYRWAFGINDVVDTVTQKGPVVLGLNWYAGMYDTDADGLVKMDGDLVGGHCITAVGYRANYKGNGPCVEWVNSWGASYGLRGVGYIKVPDLAALLSRGGEACIATDIIRR